MPTVWLHCVLGALATWRLTHLLALEDGPWDLVLRLRLALGNSGWGRLLDCFYCLSLWVAAPLALAVARDPLEWLLAWLGLSGAACLLERLGAPAAVEIPQPMPEGEPHALLWTETRSPGGEQPEKPAEAADALRIVR